MEARKVDRLSISGSLLKAQERTRAWMLLACTSSLTLELFWARFGKAQAEPSRIGPNWSQTVKCTHTFYSFILMSQRKCIRNHSFSSKTKTEKGGKNLLHSFSPLTCIDSFHSFFCTSCRQPSSSSIDFFFPHICEPVLPSSFSHGFQGEGEHHNLAAFPDA